MYNVDFKRLAVLVTPHYMRVSRILLMLMACTWPLRQLYNAFIAFVDSVIYRLSHNSQVCYLEKVMNDHFDITQRRIYITDFTGVQRLYFWPEADLRDVDFSITQFFWEDAAYADSGIDFIVNIPMDVATTDPLIAYMKSLLNEYKLPGKNYLIIRF